MTTWSHEQVADILREKGWLKETREIENGTQFLLNDGTPIDWYKTGRVVVRGKATELKKRAQELFQQEPTSPGQGPFSTPDKPAAPPKRVFIVYGHDAVAREQLELILRRMRIEPIVLQNIPAGGDTIIEKLENLTEADFACVLLTPDDEGYQQGHQQDTKHRARQNAVLEMGMVLARLGRKRVAVLVKDDNLERPSDIAGLIYISFRDKVEEVKTALGAFLEQAGFDIQVKDLL